MAGIIPGLYLNNQLLSLCNDSFINIEAVFTQYMLEKIQYVTVQVALGETISPTNRELVAQCKGVARRLASGLFYCIAQLIYLLVSLATEKEDR